MVIPETTIVLPLRSMPDSQFTVKKVNSQSKKSDKNVGKKTTFRGLVEFQVIIIRIKLKRNKAAEPAGGIKFETFALKH